MNVKLWQVTRFYFNVDYKTRHRQILGWCLLTAVIAPMWPIAMFVTNGVPLRDVLTKPITTVYFAMNTCQLFLSGIILTTYFTLVFNLHYRYYVLNSMLRY